MIGEKLGNYTVLEIIGSGSIGTVYKAEDSAGQYVAVKLVRSQVLQSMEKRERFLQCLLAASEMKHHSLCPILEIGDDNNDFFIITPFIQGTTLENVIGKKPLPPLQALHIAREIASALEVIHSAGTVHRGLRPSNIWILNAREKGVILSDYCIARFTETSTYGRIRSAVHKAGFIGMRIPLDEYAYMSPEQIRGESLDARTDIFSFGVVLFEMLSGRHPFEARNSLSRVSAILKADPPPLFAKHTPLAKKLESTINKALAKNREYRYQSVNGFMSDIIGAHESTVIRGDGIRFGVGLRKWFADRFIRKHL